MGGPCTWRQAFMIRGPLLDREVVLALVRHLSLIHVGAAVPPRTRHFHTFEPTGIARYCNHGRLCSLFSCVIHWSDQKPQIRVTGSLRPDQTFVLGSKPPSILVAEDVSVKVLPRAGYVILEAADRIAALRIAE
jgi:hypothetical protein